MKSLNELVRGPNGAGIGCAEAEEIARRYSKAIGLEGKAEKHGGTWYFVSRRIGSKMVLSAAVDDLYEMGEF